MSTRDEMELVVVVVVSCRWELFCDDDFSSSCCCCCWFSYCSCRRLSVSGWDDPFLSCQRVWSEWAAAGHFGMSDSSADGSAGCSTAPTSGLGRSSSTGPGTAHLRLPNIKNQNDSTQKHPTTIEIKGGTKEEDETWLIMRNAESGRQLQSISRPWISAFAATTTWPGWDGMGWWSLGGTTEKSWWIFFSIPPPFLIYIFLMMDEI